MKSITYSKSSWHYRFRQYTRKNSLLMSMDTRTSTGFCEYWRDLFIYILGFIPIVILAGVLAGLIAVYLPLLPLVSFVQFGFIIDEAYVGLFVLSLEILLGLVILAGENKDKVEQFFEKPIFTGIKEFFSTWYTVYKEKYCPLVTIVDDEKE